MLHVSVESEVRDYIIIKKIEDIFMDLILSIDLAGFLNHWVLWGTHTSLEKQKKKERSSAPNASTHTPKVAHSPYAPVPLSMVQ